jgi:protein-disulfide isomerase
MKRLLPGVLAAVVLLSLGAAGPACAQSRDEVEKLKKEVAQLKAAQQAMQKEMQELRQLIPKRGPSVESPVNVVFETSGDPVKGDSKAPLTLVEFSEFQCGFCARHVKETFPDLEKDYIKTGKIKYVFKSFPLDMHTLALKASEAADCAGEQGKFWEMHDRLFAHQDQLQPEKLPTHAKELDLDMTKFQACLGSGKYAAEIQKSIAEGKKAGVNSTPTFFIAVGQPNDSKVKAVKGFVGAKKYEVFKAALDSLLAPPSNPVNPLAR